MSDVDEPITKKAKKLSVISSRIDAVETKLDSLIELWKQQHPPSAVSQRSSNSTISSNSISTNSFSQSNDESTISISKSNGVGVLGENDILRCAPMTMKQRLLESPDFMVFLETTGSRSMNEARKDYVDWIKNVVQLLFIPNMKDIYTSRANYNTAIHNASFLMHRILEKHSIANATMEKLRDDLSDKVSFVYILIFGYFI